MKRTRTTFLWILCLIMALSLTAVCTSLVSADEADYSNAVLYADFEDGVEGFYKSGSGSCAVAEGAGYGGGDALQVNGIWTRNNLDGEWIQQGKFYELSTWIKLVSGTTQARGEMYIWGQAVAGGAWKMCSTRIVTLSSTTPTSEYTQASGVFGVYSDGVKAYAYHDNGKLVELTDIAAHTITYQTRFDLGATNSGSILYDNLAVVETTVNAEVSVTIVDSANAPVTGAELTVYDAEGQAIAAQPTITEESGVYTMTLPFATFDQQYKIGVEGATCTVSFLEKAGTLILDVQEEEEEKDYSKAILFADFEEGANGFYGTGSGTCVVEEGAGYGGGNALKVNGIWIRNNFDGEWIQQGNFFEFSAWVKIAAGTPQASAQMYIWGMDAEEAWKMCNTRINALKYTTISDQYAYVSGIFGVYSDGTTAYAYHNGGTLIELSELAGHTITYQTRFDLGATNSGSIYYDKVAIIPTAAVEDATLTVYGVEGASLVVCDAEGNPLLAQPEIIENEGVFTIKALPFNNFTQKYVIKVMCNGVEVGSQQIDFVNRAATVSPAYTGTVTVKDVNGNAITNATVSYGDVTVTENTDGVYSLVDLLSSADVTITCEGLLPKYVTVTPDAPAVEVVLKAEVPATVVDGNMVAEGNMEAGLSLFQMKQGVEGTISDKEQYDGKKSWELVSSREGARIMARPSGIDTDGTVYYLEVMAKSNNGATMSLGALTTATDPNGAYCYPGVTGEAVALTSEWQKMAITFSFRLDEATRKYYVSINGGAESEFSGEVSTVAAIDLTFNVSNGGIVYVDNIILLETYTGSVSILDAEGNSVSGATFAVTDFAGRAMEITPAYDEATGKYTFANLAGSVKVVATAGEKTYDAVTLTKALKDVTVESSYVITVTLKDQFDAAVIGADVIARKGISNVGTFTDNGDGTYTLEGVMGTVSIVVVVDGYDFTRTDNVSAQNASLTIVGEKYQAPADSSTPDEDEPQDEPQDEIKKGCFASVGMTASVMFALVAAFGAALLKKKEN